VFFKMPFCGIPWGCTHVLCGSPTGKQEREMDLSSLLQFKAVLVVVVVALRARHHPRLDGIDQK